MLVGWAEPGNLGCSVCVCMPVGGEEGDREQGRKEESHRRGVSTAPRKVVPDTQARCPAHLPPLQMRKLRLPVKSLAQDDA